MESFHYDYKYIADGFKRVSNSLIDMSYALMETPPHWDPPYIGDWFIDQIDEIIEEILKYANNALFCDLKPVERDDNELFKLLTSQEYDKSSELVKKRQDFLVDYNFIKKEVKDFRDFTDNMDNEENEDKYCEGQKLAIFYNHVEDAELYLVELFNHIKEPTTQ